MGRSIPKNQHFVDENGKANFLVSHDWEELNKLPEGTRIWVTATQAAGILEEEPPAFYYLLSSGQLPHRYLKTNESNVKGICIVPMGETFALGTMRLAEKTKRELPEFQKKLRKLGTDEKEILERSQKLIEITEEAIQRLRKMGEQVLSLKGKQEGLVNGPTIVV